MTDVASQPPAPSEQDRAVLTNRQGHPVYDNQNQRTVGARGPATLEDYQFLEKISHSTGNASRSAWSMRAEPPRSASSRHTVPAGTSRSRR